MSGVPADDVGDVVVASELEWNVGHDKREAVLGGQGSGALQVASKGPGTVLAAPTLQCSTFLVVGR